MTTVNRIGIFGTSGMAREAGDIACALGIEAVYVARDQAEMQAWHYPGTVILEQDIGLYIDIPFVIGIGEGVIRKAVAERFKDELRFTNLIHPSATFGMAQREAIECCTGAIIAAGARFTSGISVGDFCIVNQNVTVAHDCIVGNYVHLAPGANVSGNVQLHDGCWIGVGAVINQGNPSKKLEIGANTVVGAGAVVIDDCDHDAVYVGVPAKRIK